MRTIRHAHDHLPEHCERIHAGIRVAAVWLTLALAVFVLAAAAPTTAGAASCSAEQGQAFIDQGSLERAVREFSCVVNAQPTAVEGYRGRIEAELLLGRYSDALADYALVTKRVVPVDPDAHATILDGYAERLATDPDDAIALTGASFARWAAFDYPQALHLLARLLEVAPGDRYGTVFRGSTRLLKGVHFTAGAADLEQAIADAPDSPDVRWLVADAYTYGLPDPGRAFAEASLALEWGLDTPRVHAILAASLNAFGQLAGAAEHILRHNELVTEELVPTAPLAPGGTAVVDLVPGRTFAIPVAAVAGQTISIGTTSHDIWDSIAVLLAPDGTPVVGADDTNAYMAAFDWVAAETGTYVLQVTSFEAVLSGELTVTRG